MPNTPNQALPYPSLTDPANGPVGFQQLAEAIEKKLVMVFASAADRDAKITAPTEGMTCWRQDANVLEIHDGTAWRWNGGKAIACRAQRTAVLSVANNTQTVVPLTAADIFDTAAMHNPASNSSRVFAPEAGIYLATAEATFTNHVTGNRQVNIAKNQAGTMVNQEYGDLAPGHGTNSFRRTVSGPIEMAVNDYVELFVWQTSGAALDLTGAQLTLTFIGAAA